MRRHGDGGFGGVGWRFGCDGVMLQSKRMMAALRSPRACIHHTRALRRDEFCIDQVSE